MRTASCTDIVGGSSANGRCCGASATKTRRASGESRRGTAESTLLVRIIASPRFAALYTCVVWAGPVGAPRNGTILCRPATEFFDDLAKVASGAASTLVGVKQEIEAFARQQVERLVGEFDLVRRDEFEAVQALAANARAEQERLEQRVAALEEKLLAIATVGADIRRGLKGLLFTFNG